MRLNFTKLTIGAALLSLLSLPALHAEEPFRFAGHSVWKAVKRTGEDTGKALEKGSHVIVHSAKVVGNTARKARIG